MFSVLLNSRQRHSKSLLKASSGTFEQFSTENTQSFKKPILRPVLGDQGKKGPYPWVFTAQRGTQL